MSISKGNWKLYVIIGVSALFVILTFVFIANSFKNYAINLEEQIETAKSDIKVQEKRRANLIPNLVDCVKNYNEYEYQTLMDVISSRNLNNDNDVEEVKDMINITAEAYPELKSSENYRQLMTELSTTENLIAEYRSNYNKQVKEYKRYVRKFPNKQFLNLTGYEVLEYDYLDYDVSSDAPTNLFGE